jgi:hypothetical protein
MECGLVLGYIRPNGVMVFTDPREEEMYDLYPDQFDGLLDGGD